MSTTTAQANKQPNRNTRTTFSVVESQIPCRHKIQLYVDYGNSDGGPWLRIGINETEFGIGYLPATNTELRVASADAT